MKILLAIDGSACSDSAVCEVGRHPWPPGTEVRIIIVDAPLDALPLRLSHAASSVARIGSPSAYDQLVQEERAQMNNALLRAAESLHNLAPQLSISAALIEGSPKEKIIEEAQRWAADMIVVGSQGRGAIRSLFLGSVSLAVVLNAPCSVLVVRPSAGNSADAAKL